MNFDIVVVGASASGISAALTASECGAKVALLEKRRQIWRCRDVWCPGTICG